MTLKREWSTQSHIYRVRNLKPRPAALRDVPRRAYVMLDSVTRCWHVDDPGGWFSKPARYLVDSNGERTHCG